MNLLFRAVVGSQAYGTSTPTSDIDYKGIFASDLKHLIGFGYKEQIEIGKDETLYEVRRFLQLIQSANPTVHELHHNNDSNRIQRYNRHPKIENRNMLIEGTRSSGFGG